MNKFIRSFGYAFHGFAYAFKTQLNFKIHCVVAILVVALGLHVGLVFTEWICIVLAIGLVMIVELINTAIEVFVDLVSPEKQPKAGIIKDVAAAAVLCSALVAAIVGLIVFVPKLI